MNRPYVISKIFVTFWMISCSTLSAKAQDTLRVNDLEISIEKSGEGPPILFVHGAVADMAAWDGYPEELNTDYSVIRYTQRYFGSAPWPDQGEAFSLQTHVDDLVDLMRVLDVGPVHLVGWSYGGEIAIYSALEAPELFASMVLFEPSVGAMIDKLPGVRAAERDLGRAIGPAFADLERGNTELAALRFIEGVFGMEAGSAANEPAGAVANWTRNARTIAPYFSAPVPSKKSCLDLKKLKVPTLVVQGENSHVWFGIASDFVADCLANAQTAKMAGVAHDGPHVGRESFVALIKQFVSEQ